ncbi:hexosaminidase D-like [Carassius auratus]|uniref:Hexosaminidase D-like n=1 Tax=Carassius auratus TaxID=7957 RepID=A0A6P6L1S8_CARAU|nr:hexosaminidase D-like [Carassius auratus]
MLLHMLFADLGANGLLIEYEDMFSNEGELKVLQSTAQPPYRLSSRTSCSFAGAKLAELIVKLTSLLESTELIHFQNNMIRDAVESQVREVRGEMCLLYSDSTAQECTVKNFCKFTAY